MAKPKEGAPKKPPAAAKKQVQEVVPPSRPWYEIILNLFIRFSRFGWDLIGTILLVFGFITAFALLGLTRGALVSPYQSFLQQWLGYGSWIFALLLLVLGGLCLSRRWAKIGAWSFGRILAIEGLILTLFPLLTILGGGSLQKAEMGMDGGILGWGLAEMPLILGLTPDLRTALLILLFALFTLHGSGLGETLARKLDTWLSPSRPILETNLPAEVFEAVSPMTEPEAVNQTKTNRKTRPQIPPEYRKSFPVEEEEAEPAASKPRDERLPPLNLLLSDQTYRPDERHINLTAGLIEKTLAEFGVPAKVVGFRIGPTVTQYAVEPGFVEKPGSDGEPMHQKIRVSQISNLSRDLALALSAERLRIEAPVPGAAYVGIEVPNSRVSMVRLRPILEAEVFSKIASPLGIAMGRDVSGRPVVADLGRMPHLLIAGTTGSGKSICIAAITTCLVMNNTPEDLRLIMIDPKMVELVRFNGLPHLYGKVETNLERILGVLRWVMAEMDNRYKLLEEVHARDISAYNRKMEKRHQKAMPRIVVLIDELADLMMSAPDQTEHSLVRLAQLARATGIHLVVATQRPSTDVVTGLIKANFPARISFTVASSVDSRVILDTNGAETLLGRGDMLFLNPENGTPQRAQGVMVTDQEIEKVITHWQKMVAGETVEAAPWEESLAEGEESGDNLVEQAIEIIRNTQKASASLLQRRLRIGYPRAARLLDELEELGVVGPSLGGGREREVLVDPKSSDDDDPTDEES